MPNTETIRPNRFHAQKPHIKRLLSVCVKKKILFHVNSCMMGRGMHSVFRNFAYICICIMHTFITTTTTKTELIHLYIYNNLLERVKSYSIFIFMFLKRSPDILLAACALQIFNSTYIGGNVVVMPLVR